MSFTDDKLKAISDQLKKGVAPPAEKVRAFLGWFGYERRGYRAVKHIRYMLNSYKLSTKPDFEFAYIDGQISFVHAKANASSGATEDFAVAIPDPTHRVGRLQSANTPPVSVAPDSTLQQIVTVMLTHDFSQVPVMTGPREVKGVVSWKTVGSRLALQKPCNVARLCMEPAQIISSEESLFSAISVIAAHDYVLVKTPNQLITGIITASDFNEQFRKLAEPFLLVGEIENGIRGMLHGKFTAVELKAAKKVDDGPPIEGVADLTFGDYVQLIGQDKHWKRLNLEIDRGEFVKRLDKIREIRNDVVHFDPDGLDGEDLTTLREFAQFLRRLRSVGAI